MLIRVPKDSIRLGMYIQSIEGSWLEHPFWRSKFVLTDPADLQALQQSKIWGVIVDDEKSQEIGLLAPEAALAAPEEPPSNSSPPASPGSRRGGEPSPELKAVERRQISPVPSLDIDRRISRMRSPAAEFERAAQIVRESRRPITQLMNQARLGNAVDAGTVMPLVEEIFESVDNNPSALISITRIRTKDEYTYMHSLAVCALMVNLARQIGLDEKLMRELGLAGLLHDIGKMAVPTRLLAKPGKLSDPEFDIVKAHPERGHDMLKRSSNIPEVALEVCLHHHEKLDGSGYPHGLKGDEISRYARMGAICDVYDAVTSNRPYKQAWGPADSISEMFKWEGHFDKEMLTAFIRSLGIYPVGSLVRLESDRLALVCAQTGDLTKPVVRIFYSISSRMKVRVHDLDLSATRDDRIVSREDPAKWGFSRWDEQWTQMIRLAAEAA